MNLTTTKTSCTRHVFSVRADFFLLAGQLHDRQFKVSPLFNVVEAVIPDGGIVDHVCSSAQVGDENDRLFCRRRFRVEADGGCRLVNSVEISKDDFYSYLSPVDGVMPEVRSFLTFNAERDGLKLQIARVDMDSPEVLVESEGDFTNYEVARCLRQIPCVAHVNFLDHCDSLTQCRHQQ